MAHRIPCLKHQPSLAISEVAPKLSQGVWLYSCIYSLAHSMREHACLMNILCCTNTCEGFVSRCIRGNGNIVWTHCGAPTVEPQLPLFLEIRDTNNAIIVWFIYCWHRYFFVLNREIVILRKDQWCSKIILTEGMHRCLTTSVYQRAWSYSKNVQSNISLKKFCPAWYWYIIFLKNHVFLIMLLVTLMILVIWKRYYNTYLTNILPVYGIAQEHSCSLKKSKTIPS